MTSIHKIPYTPMAPENGMPAIWHVRGGSTITAQDVPILLRRYKSEIEIDIRQFGGLLIRGLKNVRTAEDFETTIRQLYPELRDYIGGTSPRRTVRGKIMTATEIPSDWSVPLHQEMAYTHHLPERIIFFCERPANAGGHSLVGDMSSVTQRIDPEVWAKFEKLGLRLKRVLPSPAELASKPGIKKSWTDVFGTSDRALVQRIADERGWQIEWKSNGSAVLSQELTAATRVHRITGESLWCNQAHFFAPAGMLAWAKEDRREADVTEIEQASHEHPESLDNVLFGNGEPISDSEAMHLYRVISSIARPVCMQRSDLLILDNLRFAHGRTAFKGARKILVALADC